MASDIVIRAEHLGKKYIIGHQSERESYTALRDVIARSARSWARSVRDLAAGRANVAGDELEEFWALKNVNFEIRRGDVVGVIGRNGAGKSTLLKVLSRITEPSEGRVEIRGRVASLLEVGTGFHPELTGRENIYLNGAILGMSRAEIKKKFDEIVTFAEIERFLDTPVKRYSSGMYVRLAFAVAAHLEPEILIVDEVLAVGDAEFQKKCLGKMQDVAGHGRTVLFVSHNMAAVRTLCPTSILLNRGKIAAVGSSIELVRQYLDVEKASDSTWIARDPDEFGNPFFQPQSIGLAGAVITLTGRLDRLDARLLLGFSLETADETLVFWTHHRDCGQPLSESLVGKVIDLTFELPLLLLNAGLYRLRFVAFLHNQSFIIEPGRGPHISFRVPDALERHAEFEQPRPGVLAPALKWSARESPRPNSAPLERVAEDFR